MENNTLYRKFRPLTFDEVVGQDTIVRILRNQIENDKVGHAYLFCGTRGTGKTTIAKIFARTVNCEHKNSGNPCNSCPTCLHAIDGSNLNIIEIDAASNNGIENIRNIINIIEHPPVDGEKKKVFIIDEVHSLSNAASNALLKTLEEPPEYALFILCTTEPEELLDTIRSRCQRYDFHRIEIETIKKQLKKICEIEDIKIDDEAISYIALKGDGSMRDAISLLERCRGYGIKEKIGINEAREVLGSVDTKDFKAILEAIDKSDVKSILGMIGEIIDKGKDISQFVEDFIWYLRNVLIVKKLDGPDEKIMITIIEYEDTKELSDKIGEESLLYYIERLSKLERKLKSTEEKRVLLETELLILATPRADAEIKESFMSRVSVLEDRISNHYYVEAGDHNASNNKNDNNFHNQTSNNSQIKNDNNSQNNAKTEIYLDKATYDEIKTIIDRMNEIKAGLEQGTKAFLDSCAIVPASDKDSGTINIIPKTDVIYNCLVDDDEFISILEKNTESILKKKVKYKLLNIKDKNATPNIILKLKEAGIKIEKK